MKSSRYSISRQKACQQCSNAKARCDRNTGNEHCVRCTQRDLLSAYPNTNATAKPNGMNLSQDEARLSTPFSVSQLSFTNFDSELLPVNVDNDPRPWLSTTSSSTIAKSIPSLEQEKLTTTTCISDRLDAMNFSNLHLICPINADDIKNRWIQTYMSAPGQLIKAYSTGVSAFIYHVLKSYTAVAVNGHGTLPFIHSQQMTSQPAESPLTTCLSLVRICSSSMPGSNGAAARS